MFVKELIMYKGSHVSKLPGIGWVVYNHWTDWMDWTGRLTILSC